MAKSISLPKGSWLERLPLYDTDNDEVVEPHCDSEQIKAGPYRFHKYFYAHKQLSPQRYTTNQKQYTTALLSPPVHKISKVISLSTIPASVRTTGFFFRSDGRTPEELYLDHGFWARCAQKSRKYSKDTIIDEDFILHHVQGSNDCVSTSRSPFQSRNGFETPAEDGYCYLYCVYVYCGVSVHHFLCPTTIDSFWHENEVSILEGIRFDHIVGFARYHATDTKNRSIFLSEHWFSCMKETERKSIFAFLTGCIPKYASIRYHENLREQI